MSFIASKSASFIIIIPNIFRDRRISLAPKMFENLRCLKNWEDRHCCAFSIGIGLERVGVVGPIRRSCVMCYLQKQQKQGD